MTLPTTTSLNGGDDDSDMFGPPRSSLIGYHHHRSRVPMISPKLRQREERKRILQLCAHKLERIKDSETNLRRSVCINNTYCRLNDELRREKQSRYLANLPKSETKLEAVRENIFNPYNSCGIDSSNHQPSNKLTTHNDSSNNNNANNARSICSIENHLSNVATTDYLNSNTSYKSNILADMTINNNNNNNNNHQHSEGNSISHANAATTSNTSSSNITTMSTTTTSVSNSMRKRHTSSTNFDTDLEILDRELNAINAPMPLIDPEITQGAEQLERAISSRKRTHSEEESDRLVREALSHFYTPPRVISAIEDCPLDIYNISNKRAKLSGNNNCTGGNCSTNDLELDFDIMDTLRLSTSSPTASMSNNDSCGQAAMLSESPSVFHNLIVTSLET